MAPDVAGDVHEQEERRACEGDSQQQAGRADERPRSGPAHHQRELGNPEHETRPGGDVGGSEEPGLVLGSGSLGVRCRRPSDVLLRGRQYFQLRVGAVGFGERKAPRGYLEVLRGWERDPRAALRAEPLAADISRSGGKPVAAGTEDRGHDWAHLKGRLQNSVPRGASTRRSVASTRPGARQYHDPGFPR